MLSEVSLKSHISGDIQRLLMVNHTLLNLIPREWILRLSNLEQSCTWNLFLMTISYCSEPLYIYKYEYSSKYTLCSPSFVSLRAHYWIECF